jgi:hypothetical protein
MIGQGDLHAWREGPRSWRLEEALARMAEPEQTVAPQPPRRDQETSQQQLNSSPLLELRKEG